jgi:integrase
VRSESRLARFRRSDLWPHSTAAPAGEPYAPGVLSRYWRETLQAAGIRHIKLHAARHTCATLMHLQGVPAAVIAAWIGHKDVSLTIKLYAHSQDDALKAAGATSNRVVTSRDTDALIERVPPVQQLGA